MIHSLSRELQERKSKLRIYLQHNRDIKLEKKHQIKGAIDELDKILKILKNKKKKETYLENNPKDDVFLFRPLEEKTFMEKAKEYVKDMF